MSISSLLSKPHSRRVFLTVAGLLVLVLVLVRYLGLPQLDQSLAVSWPQFAATLTEKILISVIVTVAIALFYFWLVPPPVRTRQIELVEARELPAVFDTAFPTTQSWLYRGGCGRYLRTVSIPKMATYAREISHTREIAAVILDPRDEALCKAYARYRSSTKSAGVDGPWTLERVRQEVYATIVSTIYVSHREPLVSMNLWLSPMFSSFRIDMCSEFAIITKEDRLAPAIRADRGSYLYDAYRGEISLVAKQSTPVNFPKGGGALAPFSAEAVKNALASTGLGCATLNDDDYNEISRLLEQPRNPYA